MPEKLCLSVALLLSLTCAIGFSSNGVLADDDPDANATFTDDDDGNRTYYDENAQPIKTIKLPYSPKKKPGTPIKLPNGKDAFKEADGTIRWVDDKGNVFEVMRNPKNPNLHTIIQQLMNGINAITAEGGRSVYNMPGSGSWTFDPQGKLLTTPYGPYGAPPGPNMERTVADDGVITTIYTDPTFGGTTTVIDGRTMKGANPGDPGMTTTSIRDPKGNTVVNTPNGPLIYGPDGKIISKTGFEPTSLEGNEGHHHGPDGSEIPNFFFNPASSNKSTTPSPTTTSAPDKTTPQYMKVGPAEMKDAEASSTSPPYKKNVNITAKQGGPFNIKAEVESSKQSYKTTEMK